MLSLSNTDDRRRTDGCDGPDVDEPALDIGGCLPFEVGCPTFTRELRQSVGRLSAHSSQRYPRSMMEG